VERGVYGGGCVDDVDDVEHVDVDINACQCYNCLYIYITAIITGGTLTLYGGICCTAGALFEL
jgi:hypothetical protein